MINRLRGVVLDGTLGAPMGYLIRDDQYWPTGAVVPGHSSWRSERSAAGGGALIEHSIHSADIACWLFGPVRTVQAQTRSMFGFDVEDVAALTITHDSGVVGTLLTVFNGVRGREERRVEVFLEAGAVEVTTDFVVGASEDRFLIHRPDEPARLLDSAVLAEAQFTAFGLPRRDFVFYTYPADRAFIEAVRRGEPPAPTFDDARRAHQLVEAAYRSAATGEAVAVTSLTAPP